MISIYHISKAVEHEVQRQIDILEGGGKVSTLPSSFPSSYCIDKGQWYVMAENKL